MTAFIKKFLQAGRLIPYGRAMRALTAISLAFFFTLTAANAHAPARKGDRNHRSHASKPVSPTSRELRSAQQAYEDWLPGFRARAIRNGIDGKFFDEVMRQVRVNPDVLKYDRWQPEKTKSFIDYERLHFKPAFLTAAENKMRENDFDQIAGGHVDKQVLITLWGFESGFGSDKGGFYVPESLATLAAAGHENKDKSRRDMFAEWLITTLQLMQDRVIDRDHANGSWAACEGEWQFSPADIKRYGVDGDGDGKKDVPNNRLDAAASAVRKLAGDGWIPGEPWGERVALPPGFNMTLTGFSTKGHDRHRPVAEWRRLGVVQVDGSPLPGEDQERVEVVAPGFDKADYKGGPVFVARHNADVLMKWNNSSYFVFSVLEIADRIAAESRATVRTEKVEP